MRWLIRWSRRSALVTLGVAVAIPAAFALPGPAQAAAPAVALPFSNAADVVASGGRVFVSGGANSTEIAVAAADGTLTGTLSDLPGPADLLVSGDERTLYVALPDTNTIVAFEIASLREVARYATGRGECPSSLAQTGGYLWFGYGCDQWGGNIGRVDLGAQPAVVTTGLAAAQDFYDHPMLSAAAGNPQVLLATEPGLSPTSAYAYAVEADGTLKYLREDDHNLGSNLRDAALDPTGTRVYLAAGAPYSIEEYAFADLTVRARSFPTGPYPNAVELSQDGRFVAAGIDGSYEPDVYLFTADGVRRSAFELGQRLIDGGLAWAPNGRRVYAVSADSYGDDPPPARLHVLPVPAS